MSPDFNDWFIANWTEVFAVATALIYLFLSIRQNIWLWPVGLFSSALYVWIFFDIHLYADMGLSVYYVLVSIFGWYHWQFGSKSGKPDDLKIKKATRSEAIYLAGASLLCYVLILQALLYLPRYIDIPQAEMPYLDSFTTSLSIVATWMLTKKYIEQWLVFILVDIVATGMYIYKGITPTAFLYSIYTLLAVIGYKKWEKTYRNQ